MVHVIDFLKNEVKKTCLLDIGKNHKINLIFGHENSIMELFTTIIILIHTKFMILGITPVLNV